jgi:hypothetical protein
MEPESNPAAGNEPVYFVITGGRDKNSAFQNAFGNNGSRTRVLN